MKLVHFPFRMPLSFIIFQKLLVEIVHRSADKCSRIWRECDCLLKLKRIARTCRRKREVISETQKNSASSGEVGNHDRFLKNISLAKTWLKATDSTLNQLKDIIVKVKNIIFRVRDQTSDQKVYKQAADEVQMLFAEILKTADSQDTKKDIYACNHKTLPSPFRKAEGGMVYQEDIEKIELEVEPNSTMKINLVGSNFLTKPLKILGEDVDLNPGIDQDTRLSDLNRGRGVDLGSITIANNYKDASWDINLNSAVTVGDVINAINSCGIADLNAKIGASQKGLKLTYTGLNESDLRQQFTISEAGGTTARDLGILTTLSENSTNLADGLKGRDLDPILIQEMPVFLLKSGQGLTLGTIRVSLGEAQRVLDLSSTSAVGDIIDTIDNSIPGVIATINNSQKGISVESTIVGKSLVIYDDDKKSAHSLGISGSPDILGTLLFLMEGLNNEDCQAISEGLETLNLGIEEISNHRAEIRAKVKRLENIVARSRSFQSETSRALSEIEDTDLSKATTDLVNQKAIYQSALQNSAAMIQAKLLDFIR